MGNRIREHYSIQCEGHGKGEQCMAISCKGRDAGNIMHGGDNAKIICCNGKNIRELDSI